MEKWKFKWEIKPSIEKSNVNTTCIVLRGSLFIEQVKQRSCDTCKNKDVEGWKNPCLGCIDFIFYEPIEREDE